MMHARFFLRRKYFETVTPNHPHARAAPGRPSRGLETALAAYEDSPWYPSARLFMRSAAEGWPAVIERVERALDGWTA